MTPRFFVTLFLLCSPETPPLLLILSNLWGLKPEQGAPALALQHPPPYSDF